MSESLIDIGANLAHDSFDRDRDAVLARAAQAGVARIIVTGSGADSNEKALKLARHYAPSPLGERAGVRGHARLYATAGLHPHHATEWSDALSEQIRSLATEPEVVGLGECGLDYFRNYAPHDAQRRAFTAQLELAAELGKPVFLHQRDAHPEFLSILRGFRPRLADVCVHCFTDTHAALADYLALDCYVGITGWICDERRGTHLADAVRAIPANRLLAETDAPYLLPRTVTPKPRHRRNEPMYLPYVARAIADALGEPYESVARVTRENAERFFRLPPPP